ncbi:MAG: hypothetical protein ACLFT2_06365 [Candidatus Brocadiia bacterium]
MSDIGDVSALIRSEDVPLLNESHQIIGVLNPGSAIIDGQVRLLLRLIEAYDKNAAYHRHFDEGTPFPDHVHLPRAGSDRIHWEKKELGSDVMPNDSYSVRLPGLVEKVRPTVIAHARYAEIERDPVTGCPKSATVHRDGLFPQKSYEEFGIEDPRITTMQEPIEADGEYYRHLISYVACSGIWGISTSFALSNDLTTFKRLPAARRPSFTRRRKMWLCSRT